MAELVKVVKPQNPKGWHLIDVSSFDPAVHQLWVEPSASEPVPVAAAAPAPVPEYKRGPGRPKRAQG